jgi:hypothetical protein
VPFRAGTSNAEVHVRLERGAVLTFRIRDGAGARVQSADVRILNADGEDITGSSAEDVHRYRIPPGEYEVTIEHPDFVTWKDRVVLGASGHDLRVDLRRK